MEHFFKAIALAWIVALLGVQLNRQDKDMGLLLTLAGTALLALTALQFLEPVVDLLHRLQELGNLNGEEIRILLKAVGIGITGEIGAMVCADAGNSALGKAVQLLSACGILYLSVPMFIGLIDLLNKILGAL